MSAKYTRLRQLDSKFGVPVREYLTARDFGGNFYQESRSQWTDMLTYFIVVGKFPHTVSFARPRSNASSYKQAFVFYRSSQSCNSVSVTNLEIYTLTPKVLMMPHADRFRFRMYFK